MKRQVDLMRRVDVHERHMKEDASNVNYRRNNNKDLVMSSSVKLISHTTVGAGELEDKSPQDVISYVARVSNPHNQENFRTSAGLLRYCIKHQHWSIFETASMTLEINTTRGLAAQILRHRSFTFQEFSQRYANTNELGEITAPDLRRQDDKNRQNSISNLPPGVGCRLSTKD